MTAGVGGRPRQGSREAWAPVVYGRTQGSDTWWRAVPTGFEERVWLGDAVAAVIARGKGLELSPRHLLAQSRDVRLVGIACMASHLSKTMHRAELPGGGQGRPLYCFVGWLAPRRTDGSLPPVPSLAGVEADAARWAEPVYKRVMSPVWTVPAFANDSALRRSEPGEPPWTLPAPQGGHRTANSDGGTATPTSIADGRVLLWPRSAAAARWDAAISSDRPVIVTSGWKRGADIPKDLPAEALAATERTSAQVYAANPNTRADQNASQDRATAPDAEVTGQAVPSAGSGAAIGGSLIRWVLSIIRTAVRKRKRGQPPPAPAPRPEPHTPARATASRPEPPAPTNGAVPPRAPVARPEPPADPADPPARRRREPFSDR